jgi:2-hydroxymuconate-semialdehyde hydrolase
MKFDTNDVVVGGYTIRYSRAGEGHDQKLVFLHGGGPGVTALSNWEGAIQRLSSHFDCIAPDVLGFGNSSHPDPPPQGMAFTRLRVETLFGFLDALGLDQVDLVGNSMGGILSLQMMILRPDRIGRATLMGSGGLPLVPTPALVKLVTFYEDATPEAYTELMTFFLHDPSAHGDLKRIAEERLAPALRDEVRRSHLATFAGEPNQIDPELLRQIQNPISLIHGREDQVVPMDASLRLFDVLPNSQLHVLGQCGHWLQLEKPREFDALIMSFHGGGGL